MEVKEIKKRVLELNRNAMDLLKESNFEDPLEILTTALKILAPLENTKIKYKLLSITQNNLGCYYKRKNQPKIALNYLSQACKSEKKGQLDNTTRSGTYLNICAIYSSLGKHKMALKNSLKALSLLKSSEDTENYISTLVIGYHNTGVEYEFLRQANESLENYELAWQTAYKSLGSDHPLTQSMHSNLTQASKTLKEREISWILKDIDKKNNFRKSIKNSIKKYKNMKKIKEGIDEAYLMSRTSKFKKPKHKKKDNKISLNRTTELFIREKKGEKADEKVCLREKLKPLSQRFLSEPNSYNFETSTFFIPHERVNSLVLAKEKTVVSNRIGTAPVVQEVSQVSRKPKNPEKTTEKPALKNSGQNSSFPEKRKQKSPRRLKVSDLRKPSNSKEPLKNKEKERQKKENADITDIRRKTVEAIEELENLKSQVNNISN